MTDVRFSKRLGEGLSLPNSGVEVRPVTSELPGEPTRAADKLFWANVDTDSDLLVAPLPAGFETFSQLRSAQSPESLDFAVTGPPGSELRRSDERLGGVEVVRDGTSLASISPPLAHDAQGAEVPTRYEIAGDRLSLRVDHRDGDFAYPIMVDPAYTENQISWETNSGLDMAGWRFYESGGTYGNFDNLAGTGSRGRGLYISMPANRWFDAYTWGQWRFKAPGDTYVSRTIHSDVDLVNAAGRGCITAGGWNPNGWEPGYQEPYGGTTTQSQTGPAGNAPWSVCDVSFSNHRRTTTVNSTQRGNYSALQLTPFNFSGAGAQTDQVFMGGASTTITDDRPPRDLRQTGLPAGQWVSSLTGKALRIEANDDGFGTEYIDLSSPGWRSWGSKTLMSATTPCRGDRNAGTNRCPNYASLDLTLPEDREGPVEYRMSARDWLDNTSTKSWSVSVDKTAPAFTLPGAVRRDARLGSGQHQLVVDASDVGAAGATNSGVKRIEYAVDGGAPVAATKTCASGPCSESFTLDTTETGLAEGRHSIRVAVTDGVGRSKEETFEVIVDRQAPVIKPVTGTLRTSEFIKAEPYTLTVEASDGTQDTTTGAVTGTVQAGLESAEVLVGGTSVARQTWGCATGSCPQVHTFTIDGGALPEGPQPVRVVVRDAAGNEVTETFSIMADRSAPLLDAFGEPRDRSGQLLPGPSHLLETQAVDGDYEAPRSGVASLEILVDGVRRGYARQGECPVEDNCPLEGDVTLRPGLLAAGQHELKVVAKDRAGHMAEDVWTVTTERTPPTIAAAGSLRPAAARWLGAGTHSLLVDASDGASESGLRRIELAIDGRLADAAEQVCPEGGCSFQHTFDFDTTGVADGRHQVRVRGFDQSGNATSDEWMVDVDGSPPVLSVGGTLRAAEGQALSAPAYELSIQAEDGDAVRRQSGARSVEVLVDGVRADFVESACDLGDCRLSRDFTYRPAAGDTAPHEIAVLVKDEAGNLARQVWFVNNPPAGGTP